ncbi:hypothetical protein DVP68_15505 [Yersinia enterocolitica]|nr:hypothetical protein [Yersinia enterocolitica]EKN6367948.1 hypothetical protein [Yersinia enterocolitica]
MPRVHGSACKIPPLKPCAAPVLARFEVMHATALKATCKARRRGGDSIARRGVMTKSVSM